jgi:CRISPR-associated protein Csb1
MTIDFPTLDKAPRLLMESVLEPVQGSRFQPTGFADLGPALFTRPDGKRMLLVESAQSVANRLERAVLKGEGPDIAPELDGVPYVRVKLAGESAVVTSSLVEAHRLNSPFIIANKEFSAEFTERTGYKKGSVISWSKAARAVFHYDPCALLHGVFFANIEDGRLRFPRLLTGFVEAEGVEEAASGGVKNNHFDPKGEIRADGYDKDVYGNVPYSRLEFCAERIVAYFNLDLALLRSYELGQVGTQLLILLALLKVRRFLDDGLRLRTACDLKSKAELRATRPELALPKKEQIMETLRAVIASARKEKDLLHDGVLELETKTIRKEKKTDDGDDE